MVQFAPRDDGLFDVTLDTGVTVPMALSQEQLMGAGAQPMAPPQPVPVAPQFDPSKVDEVLAEAPRVAQVTPGGVDAVFSQYGGGPAPAQPPPLPAAPRPAPRELEAGVDKVFQQYGAAPQPPKKLVPVGGAGGAQPNPRDELDAATRAYLAGQLRGGGYRRIPEVPEHDELVSFGVQKGKAPDAKASLHAAIEQQIADDEVRGAANVEAGRMATMGGAIARQVEKNREKLEDEIQRRAEIDREIERRREAVDKRQAEVDQMVPDPGKFFRDRGALAGVFAAVAAALGAYSAAKTGGPNYALEILESAKDREYQAQLDAIKNARSGVESERTALADMIRDHGDPRTAKLEFDMRMDELFDRKLKADALKSGSEKVRADTEALLAERRAERARKREMLSMEMQDNVVQQWRHAPYQPGRVVGGVDPLRAVKRAAEFREASAKAMGIDVSQLDPKDMRERFIPGEGFAYSADEGKQLRAAKAGVDTLGGIADEALRIREDVKAGKLDPIEGKRRLESLKGQGAVHYKNATQMGALDKGAMEIWGQIFGNPDKFLSLDTVGANVQIRQFKKGLTDGWDAVRRSQISRDPYGQEPARARTPDSFQETR